MRIAQSLASAAFGAVIVATIPAGSAAADYFAGKTVRMVVGYPPGTAFEIYARALIQHMPRQLPGQPVMILQNMPGAGSLTATNWLANVAPKDGTVLAMPNPMNTTEPILNPKAAKFDARRLTWIGSMNSERSTCGFWSANVKSFKDLKANELVIAASGPAAGSTIDAKALRNLLGLNFRIVPGYPGLADMQLSAQRGESHGYCGVLVSMLKSIYWDDFKQGRFHIPIQMGLAKHPDLPDVPNAFDMVSEADKRVFSLIFAPWSYGRPIAAPPGLPADLTRTLRAAFHATLATPEFSADAKKLNLEINPISGPDIEKLVDELYQTPADVVSRTRKILDIPD
jgi:tripartite-type tricarboxylate transporter receptor subunit TctC